MLTLQILHASDLEGGVDAIDDAPAFAVVVDELENDTQNFDASILLSAGDNYIPGPFFSASGDRSLSDTFEGLYNAFFGLIDVAALVEAGVVDADEDGFFDNDEIEAAISEGLITFDEAYITDINGDGAADYFEEIDTFEGRIDISIMNILGFDASAVGNHEFDAGTDSFENTINYDSEEGNSLSTGRYDNVNFLQEVDWPGAQFPYLSANLDFSEDFDVGPLFTTEVLPAEDFESDLLSARVNPEDPAEEGQDSNDTKGGPATIVTVDDGEGGTEQIGVIGATTQLISQISSTGNIEDTSSPGTNDMEALAAALQPFVDDLESEGINKIILVSHLQQFALEQELATLLDGVDVIIAGGSDTIQSDGDDLLRPEDADGDFPDYPFITEDAGGDAVAVVSTDGEYSYVGRLVVEFDDAGVLQTESIDPAISGPYGTDEASVLALTGEATLDEAIAASEKATDVANLVAQSTDVVIELDSTIRGNTEVFIEGTRGQVRTEETTLGNLTADANLAAAKGVDADTIVSIKNGGGIRAAIGEVDADGNPLPTQANPVSGKEEGEISDLDIQNSLRFNNGLTLVTLSTEDLKIILEHSVASSEDGATPGQFFQLGGLLVEVDLDGTAQELDDSGNVTTEGSRILTVQLLDDNGEPAEIIIENGAPTADAPESIRVVTLDFLVGDEGDLIGGDGYPWRALGEDIVDTGIDEQTALGDFLEANFNGADNAFSEVETGPSQDGRIQFVGERTTTFDAPVATEELLVTRLTSFDTGVGEGGSEVVAFDSGRLYVTNGEADRIDIFDPSGEADLVSIDLSTLPSYDGVQSVAAGGGVIAAAAAVEVVDGARQPGIVALYDQETLELITVVTVGALPDSVSISPDGNTVAVANEGEFNSESGEDGVTENAPGTISLIDITDVSNPVVTTIGFDDTFASELRLFPGIDPSLDVEPEFTAFSPDGSQVFVSLQENNAIAVVDVATGTLVDVFSAGSTDHNLPGNEIDATDDDVIDIVNRDTVGLRMPDAIATVEIDGTTYVLSANEGDGRGDAFDDDGNPIPFGDEARGGEIAELGLFDEGTDLEGLGRLIHSTIDGDTDDNGLVDQPTTFGSRSFTIFTEDGTEVFDSGSTLEKIIAQYAPERFNDDDGETGQNRSDAKGPEPEAIATGVIGGETYAFVGAERDSGVFIFNISDVTSPVFVDYIDGFENGDISPETIAFIGADESSTGNAQIAVAYEVSGETVLFDLAEADGGPIMPPPVLPQDVIDTGAFYLALLGREADDEGGNFWVDEDLSRVELAGAFLNAGEFTSSNPEANTAEIVDQLYMGVYGRDGEEGGEAHWNSVGANVGDAQMVVNFVSAALAGQEGGFTTGDPFGAVEVSPGVWDFA